LREVAETGVRYLSLGYLTHSVRAPDIAMDLEVLP
jgi:nicotinate-nucleotide pyrophosphorylase